MSSIQNQERKKLATDETVGEIDEKISNRDEKVSSIKEHFQQGKQIKKKCKKLEMKNSMNENKNTLESMTTRKYIRDEGSGRRNTIFNETQTRGHMTTMSKNSRIQSKHPWHRRS